MGTGIPFDGILGSIKVRKVRRVHSFIFLCFWALVARSLSLKFLPLLLPNYGLQTQTIWQTKPFFAHCLWESNPNKISKERYNNIPTLVHWEWQRKNSLCVLGNTVFK